MPDGKLLGAIDERTLPAGSAALAKGLAVLEFIGASDRPLRFTDLTRETGLPKSTLHRILNALMQFRFIRLGEADQTYHLGHRFFELAHQVWEAFDLRGAAEPELKRLAQQERETVSLCELENDEILYIDQRNGGGPFGFRIEVGRRAPAYCSAGGKAILAFLPPHRQREVVSGTMLIPHTDRTIASEEALRADLALARARGYAISVEEHVKGVAAVAAPVFNHAGQPIAAVGVSGPRERLDARRLHTLGRDLMEAARRISGNVGAAPMSIRPSQRQDLTPDPRVECVLPWAAYLGEGPLWDPEHKRLVWVDILAPAVHVFDPDNGHNETVTLPRLVGSVALRRDGGFIALTQDGLETLELESGVLSPVSNPEAHIPENRFNDAKCDRAGRLWAGSMPLDAATPTGGLYRFDADGTWERVDSGFSVSNGLDWSPDDRTFYFVDTGPGIIYAYDFDVSAGKISRRREFARVAPEDGRPDGLTVDVEGYVWCAIWDGWCVRRYAPNGRLDREIGLPVPRPTSCVFGGEKLETLFITSARIRLPERSLVDAPLSGGVFAFEPGVRGLPAGRFGG